MLSPNEVAQVLNISYKGLAMRRSRGQKPNYVRRDDGGIAYPMEEVEAFMMGTPCSSTSESRGRRLGFLPAKTITKSRGSKSQPVISRKPGEGVSRDR